MKWLFNKIIDHSEKDTGYPADYMRDILASSPVGFFKFLLSMPILHQRKRAGVHLHQLAKLGATQYEACGPCLEISKQYALRSGLDGSLVDTALRDPGSLPLLEQSVFLLGRRVAGGLPLDVEQERVIKEAVGAHGYTELVVSSAAVRIFPALKRGLGYAEMCALPISDPLVKQNETPFG